MIRSDEILNSSQKILSESNFKNIKSHINKSLIINASDI
jgi:hypothetical protein